MTEMLICGNGARGATIGAILQQIEDHAVPGDVQGDEDAAECARDLGVPCAWSLRVFLPDSMVEEMDAACKLDPSVVYCGSPNVRNGDKEIAK